MITEVPTAVNGTLTSIFESIDTDFYSALFFLQSLVSHTHACTHAAPSVALISRFREGLLPLLCQISGALR